MKWIKKFENFTTDQNPFTQTDTTRTIGAKYDHSNSPVIRQKAKEYVNKVFHSKDCKTIFQDLGKEYPKDLEAAETDSLFDEMEKEAVDFYTKHPEKMVIDIGDGAINKIGITGGNTGNPLTSNAPVITHT